VQRWVPLIVFKRWVDGKHLCMVQRYAHLSPDHLQLHAQILSDFVRHSGDDGTNLAQQL